MAKKVNKAEVKEEQLAQLQSLEVSMLNKDKFTDDERVTCKSVWIA